MEPAADVVCAAFNITNNEMKVGPDGPIDEWW